MLGTFKFVFTQLISYNMHCTILSGLGLVLARAVHSLKIFVLY